MDGNLPIGSLAFVLSPKLAKPLSELITKIVRDPIDDRCNVFTNFLSVEAYLPAKYNIYSSFFKFGQVLAKKATVRSQEFYYSPKFL